MLASSPFARFGPAGPPRSIPWEMPLFPRFRKKRHGRKLPQLAGWSEAGLRNDLGCRGLELPPGQAFRKPSQASNLDPQGRGFGMVPSAGRDLAIRLRLGGGHSYIGLQVHYGTYWNFGGKGNWYRNIRIRELDAQGNPLTTSSRGATKRDGDAKFLAARGGRLMGLLRSDSHITVRDLSGRKLAAFEAKAGRMNAGLGIGRSSGVLLVEFRSGEDATTHRMVPL